MSLFVLPPLSLYVHLPWCVRKCPYCDFNSHERSDIPEQAYLKALLEDWQTELAHVQGRALQSIFFGGGTPSLMSGDFYHQLIAALRSTIDFADDIEITLEANPGTVEQGRFEQYRAAGINRLSIGVQSFNPAHLHKLGRIHSSNEAIVAAESARQAGFDNFNLDLMHGLPQQSTAQALEDIEQALALQPTHLSWYELTIEPNTAFFHQPPEQPDGDAMADTEEAGFALLAQHGFQRYEISAFAQAGRNARHNMNYWLFGDYLAIGAGAHGKITQPQHNHIMRYQKTRQPDAYMNGQGSRSRQPRQLAPEELTLEYFLNTLRLVEGAPTELFSARTGQPLCVAEDLLRRMGTDHLLSMRNAHIQCSALGLQHLNTVLAKIESAAAARIPQ
ncbi:MAG: radical SAM family heme chaperone HemW [Gammaproteobacteria bacterium]|jgi:putative oxygen-independent coproporphyrinogen III oxidase|nr:radical SAM family heme chaperone HemW [Gammaproteobacteria bacterium]MBQ0774932.1 radical SAM family heme chaperone HemW [Gammaproteobacteria bacterium]